MNTEKGVFTYLLRRFGTKELMVQWGQSVFWSIEKHRDQGRVEMFKRILEGKCSSSLGERVVKMERDVEKMFK